MTLFTRFDSVSHADSRDQRTQADSDSKLYNTENFAALIQTPIGRFMETNYLKQVAMQFA
jgi:hypothetical protein